MTDSVHTQYKCITDVFPQFTKGEIYWHIWTERKLDGDSGLRDKNDADARIKSTYLQDPRYFVPVSDLQPSDQDTTPEAAEAMSKKIIMRDFTDKDIKDIQIGCIDCEEEIHAVYGKPCTAPRYNYEEQL